MLLLNYRPVLSQPTGIGVYANAVLPALQTLEHVLIPGGGFGGSKDRLKRLAWSQFQLPRLGRKRKADLIFTPAPEGYLGKQVVRQVVMVHDLRPLSHPERSMQSFYFKHWVPSRLGECKHILTNSNFTASEIQSMTGVPQEKISVIPLGYNSSHFRPINSSLLRHPRPYLLHVGQAYYHKNLRRMIHAFAMLVDQYPEVDFILLGKPHPTETPRLKALVRDLEVQDRVIFKEYVPFDDLPSWYSGALALLYASMWEGFGLPIIEAMACGCPVITSCGSACEEVAGDSAVLVDPSEVLDIHSATVQVLNSSALRDRLAAKGLDRSRLFSWDKSRAATLSLLNDLL